MTPLQSFRRVLPLAAPLAPWALLVGLGGAALIAPGCAKEQAGGGGGGFEMPPMPVEVAPVKVQSVSDRFEAVGTLEAGDAITVVAEIDGVIASLPFREGSHVGKGALLAQLDDVKARAEVSRTEALRDQARTRFDRIQQVVAQGAGTAQDLDDAAAQLKVAEADHALARDRLEKMRISAPWAGFVGARRVSPGAFVRAGQEITDLANVQSLRVTFWAPERYLALLTSGAPVQVTTPVFPDLRIEGKIDVVDPVLAASTRSARIVARVDNPGDVLRAGMSCNIAAVLAERGEALTIPAEAVIVEGNESFVYVVQPDNSVARTTVQLGTRMPDGVEVTAGLAAGQSVVATGHQKIFPGAKVMPIPLGGGMPGMPGGAAGAPPAANAEGAAEPAPGEAKAAER